MQPLAHSARPQENIPAQPYRDHVARVARLSFRFAQLATMRWVGDRAACCNAIRAAALVHDLGKLDIDNQNALNAWPLMRLPFGHQDAGVRHLIDRQQFTPAVLVYSHHAGLPDFPAERVKGRYAFRPLPDSAEWSTAMRTDRFLSEYVRIHSEHLPASSDLGPVSRWSSVAWRIALSCLVDADHTDTAEHYSRQRLPRPPRRRWRERLVALDRYVCQLGGSAEADLGRNALRSLVYTAARDIDPTGALYECDSPVGTGKTTAVMAHLLRVAEVRRLRHIFVVLPYTNIIDQAVDVYRAALTLDGENPEQVVAAHHHQADFESPGTRHLATLWDCPITVTTAVQFFQTLASSRTGSLRKLHELPGSAIFIDEAHASIPSHLWPVTWKWLTELIRDWGCHSVLASGSLARFWTDSRFCAPATQLPNLLRGDLRNDLARAESRRIRYARRPSALTLEDLITFLQGLEGPRVVVLNTVQSAAVIARAYRKSGGEVLHVSTALAPRDRRYVLAEVRRRLDLGHDPNWTLIATSCLEAGVDFSFRTGVREIGATSSLVQLGGRANRHGIPCWGVSTVWSVSLKDSRLTSNPSIRHSSQVLDGLFRDGSVETINASDLCTAALQREMGEADILAGAERIVKADLVGKYREVSELYRVIDEDSVKAVIDSGLADCIENCEPINPYTLSAATVQIRRNKIKAFKLVPLAVSDDLFRWTLPYDPDFLGYMEGVLAGSDL